MKKALALLLAAAMTISLLSVNVFAATDNILDKTFVLQNNVLMIEDGLLSGDKQQEYPAGFAVSHDGDLDWVVDGSDLVLALKRAPQTSSSVKLQIDLDGAYWRFYNNSNGAPVTYDPAYGLYNNNADPLYINGTSNGVYTRVADAGKSNNGDSELPYDLELVVPNRGDEWKPTSAVLTFNPSIAFGGTYTYTNASGVEKTVNILDVTEAIGDAKDSLDRVINVLATNDLAQLLSLAGELGTTTLSDLAEELDGLASAAGLKSAEVAAVTAAKAAVDDAKAAVDDARSGAGSTLDAATKSLINTAVTEAKNAIAKSEEAVITLTDIAVGGSATKQSRVGDIIRIPLVVATTSDTVHVNVISGNQSTVSSQKFQLVGGANGTKSTLMGDQVEDRDNFIIDGIRITEKVTHVFAGSQVVCLTLTDGFYFGENFGGQKDAKGPFYEVYLGENSLWRNGNSTGVGTYEDAVRLIYLHAVDAYDDYLNAALPVRKVNFNKYLETEGEWVDFIDNNKIDAKEDFRDKDGNWPSYAAQIYGVLNHSGKGIVDEGNEYGITYGYTAPTQNDKLLAGYSGLSESSLSTIWIWFSEIKPSDNLRSKIEIGKIPFFASADNEVFGQDIYIDVYDGGDGSFADDDGNITNESVKVGKRVDYDVALTRTSNLVTLITGRYIGPSWDGLDADDNTHKTASIKIAEGASVSWWGQRTTVLALPKSNDKGTVLGAKFRKVKVTDTSNIDAYMGAKPQDYKGATNSVMYNSVLNKHHAVPLSEADGAKAGVYLNDGERHGNITVDGNTITISNLRTNVDSKASIKFDLWVSTELGLAAQENGELKIKIDPELSSGIVDKTKEHSVVIANLIDPITVTAKVSDLKIGYQFQSTQDIIVTETVKGALLKDKTVKISISDLVGEDLVFSNDVDVKVTSGDLLIKNLRATGQGGFTSQSKSWLGADESGAIVFDIAKTSTAPSTITISTVGVKLDRTVPVTNKQAYKVIVWGTAVAENYGLSDSDGRSWKADFATAGVSVPYINVVSSANDAASILTQEVKVTIGQNYYVVNGVTFTLPAGSEPFLDANSNTMVPVRFVSRALGISEEAIVWDQAGKTVTIFAPNKTVQFKVGEAYISVDGVSIPATGADGNPVSAVLKAPGWTFLPYRALANVFGIPVEWDQETKTATYNPGANTNAGLANTNTPQVTQQ